MQFPQSPPYPNYLLCSHLDNVLLSSMLSKNSILYVSYMSSMFPLVLYLPYLHTVLFFPCLQWLPHHVIFSLLVLHGFISSMSFMSYMTSVSSISIISSVPSKSPKFQMSTSSFMSLCPPYSQRYHHFLCPLCLPILSFSHVLHVRHIL